MRPNCSPRALASGVDVEEEISSCRDLRFWMSDLMESSWVEKAESCLRRDFRSEMRLRFFFSSTSLSLPESTSPSRVLRKGVSMLRCRGGTLCLGRFRRRNGRLFFRVLLSIQFDRVQFSFSKYPIVLESPTFHSSSPLVFYTINKTLLEILTL